MIDDPIAFIDLKAQRDQIRVKIDAAIAGVVNHSNFIMGREVKEFENLLAEFCGAKYVFGCGNGTDALQMVLMAEGVGPGDAVFVPAMTFVATAEVVPLLGATPIFVDVLPDTFNLDVKSLEEAINMAKEIGLNPKAVIPVDLFGQPADYPSINLLAAKHDIIVVADSAQGLGGMLNGKRTGTLATWTTTSFFPAKPLGCYGDGGAVMTDDEDRASLINSIRVHGKGSEKYDNVRVGINSRLDTIQAAILKEKIAIFPDELIARNRIAARYTHALKEVVQTPSMIKGAGSAWAQYTIRVPNRDQIQKNLREVGVPTVVYYPIPMNRQSGYVSFPVAPGGVPVSEALSLDVISLPMHAYMDEPTQDRIINACKTLIR